MFQDRFVKGYAVAIMMVLLFAMAFRLGSILEEEISVGTSVQTLRRIHMRDQREARRE